VIYYRGMRLDRAGEQRKNPEWLERQWARAHCRVFLLHNDRSLMRRGEGYPPEAVALPRDEVAHLDGGGHRVFLGLDDRGPLFALDVSRHAEHALEIVTGDREFVDLREIGWLLDAQQAAQLAYARGLLYWNRHHRFCGRCGSPTRSENGGHMRRCTGEGCARMHFPRTDPAVIMLVEDRRDPARPRCLLGRNARFPSRMMSTLAGFVDPLESLEETVAREVLEECSIRVGRVTYQASQPWPFPSSIMLGFRATAETFDIRIDGVEIAEAHWFDAAALAGFGEWGDDGDGYCLPRRDSIARWLIQSWMHEVSIR